MSNFLKGKVFILLFSITLLFLSSTSVYANPKDKQRIYDNATIFSSGQVNRLEAEAGRFSNLQKTDFMIITLQDDLDEFSLEKYIDDFYENNEIGYDKKLGNAVIMGIDVKSRKVTIVGYKKGGDYLDDHRIDLVFDDIINDLKNDEFYQASIQFLVSSDKYMKYVKGINPNNILLKSPVQLLLSIIVASIIVWAIAYTSGGRVTTNLRTYLNAETTRVRHQKDRYIRTTVTKRRKPSNNSSSGGGFSGGGGGGGSRSSGSRSF